jgi:hypothetical protein
MGYHLSPPILKAFLRQSAREPFTWLSPGLHPSRLRTWLASLSPQTFHVYSIIQCLPNYQSHPTLIPVQGLIIPQAKSIAKMGHLLFTMINMKPDFATSTFNTLVLGTRLSLWCQLPGLIPINLASGMRIQHRLHFIGLHHFGSYSIFFTVG